MHAMLLVLGVHKSTCSACYRQRIAPQNAAQKTAAVHKVVHL